ncbi:MAG: Glutamate racemase [Candidatus Giovannonibacteria bacterium GW2011_GWB1_45_9b]|uniref:Glutamate racemase n=1 Tax=Candidatus Giovannonibacteria bacterium GW2011_GWB1_45_9b TaxID=1618653 RepID=A0A0G1N879_9BACT|nr:MAG: Glutamate racemase [Candidatus Giovannonibacteria bacterium GW2011_GWB1_45_9b]
MIGVFDSGYGGLTVFKPLTEKFPQYNFIYFGDNARAPYGDKSQETIYQYTKEAVDWLFGQGCELIILACNTASSQALRKIQQKFLPEKWPNKKVLGVLIPVAEAIAQENPDKVGILATIATIESGAYLREIHKLVEHPMFNISQVATPRLVPLIEAGEIDSLEIKEVLCEYLKEFKRGGIKNIILGCTHYPLIKDLIQAELPDVKIFDSPSVIPASLENYLARHPEIEKRLSKNGVRRYITTGDPDKFSKFAKDFLSLKISAEKI